MGDVAKFRVIDGQGEIDEGAIVLPSDVALLIEQNAKHLRTIAALKGQLTRLHKVDPQASVIEGLLAYWKTKCRGPNSRCEVPLDGRRAEFVRKTLRRLIDADPDPELAAPDKAVRATALANAESRAADVIREAIDGAAAFPFREKYGKRWPEAGKGRHRSNDIPDILKNELTLEKFRALRERDEKRIAYAHELKRRLESQPMLRDVFRSLDPEYGEILARAIRWCQAQ